MPAGNITYDTRASGSRDEDKIFNFVVPSEMFLEGDKLIAVEVHQASSSGSDMIFDLEMSGTPPPVTDPDSIKLDSNSNNNNTIIRRIHTTPILFARDENPPSAITSFVFFRECFDRYV